MPTYNTYRSKKSLSKKFKQLRISRKKHSKKKSKHIIKPINTVNGTTVNHDPNNGMITSIWGPSGWFFLHLITFGYPINPTNIDKKNFYNFFYYLQYVLPCGKCKINYKNNINEVDTKLTMDVFNSRDSIKLWLMNLHNKVNLLTKKNIHFTYDELNFKYEKFRAKCDNSNNSHIGCIIPKYDTT